MNESASTCSSYAEVLGSPKALSLAQSPSIKTSSVPLTNLWPPITPPLHNASSTSLPNVESMCLCEFTAFVKARVYEHVEPAHGSWRARAPARLDSIASRKRDHGYPLELHEHYFLVLLVDALPQRTRSLRHEWDKITT
ncbi:hypothetical protein GGP41_005364 [Bipolaris sorokiniana]|uniref:Uncharacterized protein n=1 Tax=Cochliobolus sativus TaxID=45130 RepID=A0A8H6DW01_COCSA|nr:hypothetical protein GGP41_005364 [Bipolaris sorokiniana]